MKGVRSCVPLALLLGCTACSGAQSRAPDGMERRFDAPDAREARRHAPDLVISAERALAASRAHERNGEADAASDELTRARLLLDAALAETDRVALVARAHVLDERTRAAERAALDDEAAGDRLRDEGRRLAAARQAREVAAQALALAEADEARRAGRRGTADDPARRDAARVLLNRARSLLATAQTLGATEEATRGARDAVSAAERAGQDAAQALASADHAQSLAQVALGAARRAAPTATADEAAALVDDATTAGLRPTRSERGVEVATGPVFQGASARLAPAAARRIERLATLLRAHPTGRVRVEVTAVRGSVAATRAAALVEAFARAGVDASRLDPGDARPGAVTVDDAMLVFVAFTTEH